jgi:hypothetical protein
VEDNTRKTRTITVLRRFGFADASRALTNVVAKSVGGQCRVITLDDDQVAPIGTRKIIRAVSVRDHRYVFLIILVFVIMFVGNGNYPRDYWLTASLIALMQIFTIIFILSGAVSITLVLSFLIFGFTLIFGVWTAERKKKVLISSEQEIAIVVRKISKLSKKLVGPQFLVLRVASEVWQPTVAALTDCSSAIVIDVSQPSENLLWEIRTLQAIGYRKCIFVGERLSLARVNSSRGVDRRPFDGQLRELRREQEVFEYSVEQTNWGGFARTLQYRLQDFLRTRLI